MTAHAFPSHMHFHRTDIDIAHAFPSHRYRHRTCIFMAQTSTSIALALMQSGLLNTPSKLQAYTDIDASPLIDQIELAERCFHAQIHDIAISCRHAGWGRR